MNMVMDTSPSATACQPRDSKSSSPKQTPRGDDILLDTFFDHSQQLDSTAFDALLDTTFDTADDDTTSTSASVSKVKAARQSSQSDTKLQQPSSSIAPRMALFDTESEVAMQTSSSDPSFTTLPSHVHGLQLNATSGYHGMPTHAYPTNNYEQSAVAQRSLPLRLYGLPNDASHGHYYSDPVGLPNSGGFALTMIPQQQEAAFHTPHHVEQRQPTAGLLDYDNMIPEDDDVDENVNSEVADPCYAQLLYRCLLEAQDHTMSLKDIYNWVFRHSQKARDSTSTGWQNSVRHNLSMNAAFERVNASTLHGAKKGSLWRLTDRALQEGVISTTRYRKDPKRKPERRSSPALKRQISGAKGGQATRAASAHRRAMQARASGAQRYGGIERHHRGMRKQEAAYFPPTSRPTSNHPTTSPQQPVWLPNSMAPPAIPHHVSQPPSPYFLQPMEDDAFSTITHPSLSNPHTPNEVQVGYEGPSKAMTNSPAAFGSPPRGGFLTEFELSHLDHETRGLFGNHDEFMPDTPSLATEGSFISEEMTPVTMDRLSVEPMRS